MKVIAYTALRYGRDYLAYAIQSIIDSVDEYHVLYALSPSHGHHSDAPCPETRQELYEIAHSVAGAKLRWHEGRWAHEGLQRDSIYNLAPDADVILVLDADEIWSDGLPQQMIGLAQYNSFRFWRCRMLHYWRSFHRAVVYDPAYPIRVIVPKHSDGEQTFTGSRIAAENWKPELSYWINHFGYAQRPEIVGYKMKIHGHKNELRPGWFEDTFLPNRQFDCHPVGSEYWNPETVNPWDYLPSFMKAHPYSKLEVVE